MNILISTDSLKNTATICKILNEKNIPTRLKTFSSITALYVSSFHRRVAKILIIRNGLSHSLAKAI